jgi:TonB family protein
MMQLADANQVSAEAVDPPSQAPLSGDGLVAERPVQAHAVRDRSFWVALGVATLLHSTLFLGLLRHQPRAVGDADGSEDGISVSVVTEADLQSRSSVAQEGGPPPGAPAPAVQPAPPTPPPPEPEAKPQEPPPPEEAVQAAPPVPPVPELKPSVDVAKELAEDVPDLLALPGDGAAPSKKETPKPEMPFETTVTEAKATPDDKAEPQTPVQQKPKPPQKRTAALDLTPPPAAFSGSAGGGGRSAGFERPPGITKSGANDAFARGVIRALQQTMPQLRETLGRVTVRIILNQNGNVESVQVVRPSKIASLDQSVVFATKQTSYPFPPPNSNLADRTFVVTYIYH